MAKELSRTFDTANAAVIVQVLDNLGNKSTHTIYVGGPSGVKDVNAAVADVLSMTDQATDAIKAAFAAAGWSGGN